MFESAPPPPPPATGVLDALRRFALLATLITLIGLVLGGAVGAMTRPKPEAVARMTLADPRATSLFVAGQGVQVDLDRYLTDKAGVATSTEVLTKAGAVVGVAVADLRTGCAVSSETDSVTLKITCALVDAETSRKAVDAIVASYRTYSADDFARMAKAATETLDADRQRLLAELDAASGDSVRQALTQATANRIAEIENRRTNIRTTVALFGDGVSFYDPARTTETSGLVSRALKFAFIGFAAGLALAVVIVWFRADSRPVAAEPDSIAEALGMPELGSVHEPGDEQPLFDPSPQHRFVLSNIATSFDKGIVAITEVSPTPGYAATVVRLAVAAAASGSRVLLVDADNAELQVARAVGMGSGPGFAQLLNGEARPEALMSRVNLSRQHGPGAGVLGLMRPGFSTDDLASLLQSRRSHAALEQLRASFDLVIVAAPPLLASAVGTAASRAADGTVIVTERGVPLSTLANARRQIEFAATRRIGFVLVESSRTAAKAGAVLAPMRFTG